MLLTISEYCRFFSGNAPIAKELQTARHNLLAFK